MRADPDRFGQRGVDLGHLIHDQSRDLGLARQVHEARVGEAALLGPLADRRDVDGDHGGHERPLVAERHRLANERAELELVLDELRREWRAVGELAHILGAVDDGQLPARIDEARIARLQPAVGRHGVARRILLLVVADEHAGTLHLDLAAVADAHLHVGDRTPHRVGIGIVVVLERDQPAAFGGPVDLLQVDPEGAEEPERVGAERRAAGQARARVAQAELIAHRPVDEELAQPVAEPRPSPGSACRRS